MNRFCQLVCFLFCPDKLCTWQPRFSLESNLWSLQCPCGTSAPRVLSRTCRRCPVFSCGAPTTSHWGPGFDPQVWHGHPSRLKTKKNLLIVEFNSKTGQFKPKFSVKHFTFLTLYRWVDFRLNLPALHNCSYITKSENNKKISLS